MQISGMPIEFYDSEILDYIGNRVRKMVKVDKNTLTHERGKYARLCVQVNLAKPLLAMFTIKERKYNIEYEGLHMLCTTCGRFGHYTEGGGQDSNIVGSNGDGPWKIVQNTRRNHKGSSGKNNMTADINAPTTKVNSITNFTGSIFDSLGDENPEVNGEGINGEETMKEPKLGDEDMGEVNENINRMHPKKLKIKRGNGATLAVNEEASPERINKETI
ncbi:hypothetical protein TSUD_322040 [Trifolium subterraneum]|uniref:Uncharacterized protein n=1 Tax=Trifolium subterraneum TaxID=3900 RepID=A0A2Z6NMK4_TRISU|nr:hypothetical protein TSUD_322040 [Trifolium subterraneum]